VVECQAEWVECIKELTHPDRFAVTPLERGIKVPSIKRGGTEGDGVCKNIKNKNLEEIQK